MTEDTRRTTSETDESPRTTERVRYSWTETETPSVGVVEAVAAATGQAATDLPRLSDTIEPDALNELLQHGHEHDRGVHVSFGYAGVTVSVNSVGTVAVTAD